MKRFNSFGNNRMERKNVRGGPNLSSSITRMFGREELRNKTQEAKIYNRVSELRVEQLRLKEWNGFVELTDECKFGLALFTLTSPYISTTVTVPLKDISIERNIRIMLLKDLSCSRIGFNVGGSVSMPLPYVDAFNYQAIAQFAHESRLVAKLITDIRSIDSVRDRWLPNFIDDLDEIEKVLNESRYLRSQMPSVFEGDHLNISFNTIGQYIILAMCERLRRRIKHGLSLKVLFYAISLIARKALDGDYTSTNSLLTNVAVWISRGTCDDCLIKMMRFIRGRNDYEYNLHMDDSFSKYISFPSFDTVNINFGPDCVSRGITDSPERLRRTSLRTIGTHAFLTSPEAEKRVATRVHLTEAYPVVTLYPTLRQISTIRSVLDLHARVLRSHSWDQSVMAFNAWFAERRVDLSSNTNDLLSIMITDLYDMRELAPTMRSTTAHLICLLMRGTLQREMISNYGLRPKGERAHEFLIRYVFYTSPSQTVMKYADLLFKRFHESTPDERRLDISYTIENPRHSYSVCLKGQIGEFSQHVRRNSVIETTSNDRLEGTISSTNELDTSASNSTQYKNIPSIRPVSPTLSLDSIDGRLDEDEIDNFVSRLGIVEISRSLNQLSDENESLSELPSEYLSCNNSNLNNSNIYPDLSSSSTSSLISGISLPSVLGNEDF